MEYIIYCDESASKGAKYSDFFGGCIINSTDLLEVTSALDRKKDELHFHGEIKWSKVTENYLSHYIEIIDLFFDHIKAGKLKVRIMFRNNRDEPSNPLLYQNDDKYFKLYYQFIKHAFGLMALPEETGEVYLRIYLDQLPDTKVRCENFKEFLREMPNTHDFQNVFGRLHIRKDDVADVKSHNHVLLQCTDIVLGAMYFRLNDLHKMKQPDGHSRGKRTIAKEKLYKHIYRRIAEMLPYFNIGISTGDRNYSNPAWSLPYSHWSFKPY